MPDASVMTVAGCHAFVESNRSASVAAGWLVLSSGEQRIYALPAVIEPRHNSALTPGRLQSHDGQESSGRAAMDEVGLMLADARRDVTPNGAARHAWYRLW